jgi:hypothetical protein
VRATSRAPVSPIAVEAAAFGAQRGHRSICLQKAIVRCGQTVHRLMAWEQASGLGDWQHQGWSPETAVIVFILIALGLISLVVLPLLYGIAVLTLFLMLACQTVVDANDVAVAYAL